MSGSQGLPPVGAMLTVDGEMNVVLRHVDSVKGPVALWGSADRGFPWSLAAHSHALTSAWRAESARVVVEAKLEAIDSACLEVCRDNDPRTVGADGVDAEMGRFVCIGESGAPIIDEDEPSEVIRELSRVWARAQERAERAEALHAVPGQQRRIEQLEWAIVRTLYAGDIDPPERVAPFWFRQQILRDAGLTLQRCRELMDLHRGEDRVARL